MDGKSLHKILSLSYLTGVTIAPEGADCSSLGGVETDDFDPDPTEELFSISFPRPCISFPTPSTVEHEERKNTAQIPKEHMICLAIFIMTLSRNPVKKFFEYPQNALQ
jgi:hypothetical protein